jgi:hypothetical protein
MPIQETVRKGKPIQLQTVLNEYVESRQHGIHLSPILSEIFRTKMEILVPHC